MVGRSYVGNDVTHSTLVDKACSVFLNIVRTVFSNIMASWNPRDILYSDFLFSLLQLHACCLMFVAVVTCPYVLPCLPVCPVCVALSTCLSCIHRPVYPSVLSIALSTRSVLCVTLSTRLSHPSPCLPVCPVRRPVYPSVLCVSPSLPVCPASVTLSTRLSCVRRPVYPSVLCVSLCLPVCPVRRPVRLPACPVSVALHVPRRLRAAEGQHGAAHRVARRPGGGRADAGERRRERQHAVAERLHAALHGRAGEPRERRQVPARQRRQPEPRHRGECRYRRGECRYH